MTGAEIKVRVDRVLVDEFELEADQLAPSAELFADLGLDSLDAVDLIASLEEVFSMRIKEEDAKEVKTVSDVYLLIQKSLGG